MTSSGLTAASAVAAAATPCHPVLSVGEARPAREGASHGRAGRLVEIDWTSPPRSRRSAPATSSRPLPAGRRPPSSRPAPSSRDAWASFLAFAEAVLKPSSPPANDLLPAIRHDGTRPAPPTRSCRCDAYAVPRQRLCAPRIAGAGDSPVFAAHGYRGTNGGGAPRRSLQTH